MMTLHTEIAERERAANQHRTTSLVTFAGAVALLIASFWQPVRDQRQAKALVLISGALLTAVSQASARNLATHDRVLEDYRDISDAQRQQRIYEQLKPGNAPETTEDPPAPLPIHDAPRTLAGKLKSSLVLGAPRSGKGYAIAKALELLPGNVSLWLIDPKNDPNESHYWSRVPASQRIRFDVTKLDQDAVTEAVTGLFERFLQAPHSADRPKLLIIDECSPGLRMGMVKKAYVAMMGRCATIASVGPSQGTFVWIVSQATTVEDVGLSKANRASLRILAVAHATNTERSWLESVKATVAADMPAESLSGYIQMLDGQWGHSTPFTLAPVEPAAITDTPIISKASREVLSYLQGYEGPRTLRDMTRASFAQRLGLQAQDAMREALAPLIEQGDVTETNNGYTLA